MNNETTKDRPPIVRSAALCYGCRVCQLACSFHHCGAFSPDRSSIKIKKSNRTGVIQWHMDAGCDLCEKEDQPLCIKYCSYGALQLRRGS
jgi:Fe-S-cluster-containing hydrogenase component 2